MKKHSRLKGVFLSSLIMILIVCVAVPIFAATTNRTVTITNNNIKFVVNGQTIAVKDKSGKYIEPILIDGVAYVPAQAVSTAFNMDFTWDSISKIITLTAKNKPSEAGYIGLAKAKEIALAHAGVKASTATFYKTELDYDNGKVKYEIEFYSGNVEYDYDIEPVSGSVLSSDRDVEGYVVPTPSSSTQGIISLDKAKALAKAKAPKAILYSCKLDMEDGKQVYEGELREGIIEYDFEIDAVTGSFLKWSVDTDD